MDLTWLGVECDSILDKKDLLEVISRLPPVNDLRIVFHYNNCMYAVAGLVIEQQSGRPWYEFLKERILEPLGMHRTAMFDLQPPIDFVEVSGQRTKTEYERYARLAADSVYFRHEERRDEEQLNINLAGYVGKYVNG
ncbi:hypothetical protein H9L39_08250, partial [Fusarium oxysporum f. sp. albedinis]